MARKSQQLNRRARAALGWAVALFLLLQFGGGLVLDHVWTAVRFPSAAAVLGRVGGDRPPIAVVCLGSSRVGGGMNEAEISRTLQKNLHLAERPGVLNAAVPAGDLISSLHIAQRLERQGVRPKVAVIEVSPETLNHYNEWFFFHVRRQLRWGDVPRHFVSICRSGQLSGLVAARLIPLHVHRREMGQQLCEVVDSIGTDHPAPASGTAAHPDETDAAWQAAFRRAQEAPSARQRELTAIGAGQPYRWLRKFKIGGSSPAALEQLLTHCRQRDIVPVLVQLPVSAAHRAAYAPAIDAEYRAYLGRITAEHGCTFVDFHDQLPDALFIDNHHLLAEGGVYFSRLLSAGVLASQYRRAVHP